MRDHAFYEHVDDIENNVYKSLTLSDCIRIMEAKLLGNNSKAYGPTHMRRKLREFFFIKFSPQEGKADVVIFNSSASKLLHEVQK